MLKGTWQLLLDKKREVSDLDKQYISNQQPFPDSIELPGMAVLHNGNTPYTGRAWYKREVEIPLSWADSDIILHLGHTGISTVFIDGDLRGGDETLMLPQEINLQKNLKPGKHTITVRIDNDNTGGINGLTEDIYLELADDIRFTNVQIIPLAAERKVLCRLFVNGKISERQHIVATASSLWLKQPASKDLWIEPEKWDWYDANVIEMTLDLPDMPFWEPGGQEATINVAVEIVGHDKYETTTGLRKETDYSFTDNETNVIEKPFLYNTNEDNIEIFFASMQTQHIKVVVFSGECPSEEFFTEADKANILLRPTLPKLNVTDNAEWDINRFLDDERHLIITSYGHHPSLDTSGL